MQVRRHRHVQGRTAGQRVGAAEIGHFETVLAWRQVDVAGRTQRRIFQFAPAPVEAGKPVSQPRQVGRLERWYGEIEAQVARVHRQAQHAPARNIGMPLGGHAFDAHLARRAGSGGGQAHQQRAVTGGQPQLAIAQQAAAVAGAVAALVLLAAGAVEAGIDHQPRIQLQGGRMQRSLQLVQPQPVNALHPRHPQAAGILGKMEGNVDRQAPGAAEGVPFLAVEHVEAVAVAAACHPVTVRQLQQGGHGDGWFHGKVLVKFRKTALKPAQVSAICLARAVWYARLSMHGADKFRYIRARSRPTARTPKPGQWPP